MKGIYRRCVKFVTARKPAARTAPRCHRIKRTGSGTSVARNVERKCFEPLSAYSLFTHVRPCSPKPKTRIAYAERRVKPLRGSYAALRPYG